MEPMRPQAPAGNLCVFLDVDGTLIDIAPSPEAVVVPDGLVDDLRDAERALDGALALVSGRTIASLDRIFHPLRLKASGVHGAEFRLEDGGAPVFPSATPLPDATWNDLLTDLAHFPGTLAENKGYSFAVHYRAAPDSGPRLRQALGALIDANRELGLGLMPGHFVFEVKRPDVHKGAAIARMLTRPPFRGRMPVFIGDDITDRPGFETVLAHGGHAYSVGEAVPGTTGTFPDPSAVRRWVADLARTKALTA